MSTQIRLYDRQVSIDAIPDDLRQQVLGLTSWTAFGRNYRRGIADAVASGVRMYRSGRDDEGRYWIEQALSAAQTRTGA